MQQQRRAGQECFQEQEDDTLPYVDFQSYVTYRLNATTKNKGIYSKSEPLFFTFLPQ
jgi:hypothetical protein